MALGNPSRHRSGPNEPCRTNNAALDKGQGRTGMWKVQVTFFSFGKCFSSWTSGFFFSPEITVLVQLSVTPLIVISTVGIVCRAVHFYL